MAAASATAAVMRTIDASSGDCVAHSSANVQRRSTGKYTSGTLESPMETAPMSEVDTTNDAGGVLRRRGRSGCGSSARGIVLGALLMALPGITPPAHASPPQQADAAPPQAEQAAEDVEADGEGPNG